MDTRDAWPESLQQYPAIKSVLLRIDEAFRYARVLAGNDQDAMDAVQTAAVDVIASPARVPRDRDPWGWFLRVVRNKVIDLLHARSRKCDRESADPSSAARVADAEPCWLVLAVNDDNVRELRRALAGLTDNYRTAIILRYIDNLEYAEIAEILDIPLSTARQWVFQGRRQLQEALGAEFLH
jgi:RNA polymerase sigma-70 factor (ECF subfamily)